MYEETSSKNCTEIEQESVVLRDAEENHSIWQREKNTRYFSISELRTCIASHEVVTSFLYCPTPSSDVSPQGAELLYIPHGMPVFPAHLTIWYLCGRYELTPLEASYTKILCFYGVVLQIYHGVLC